MDDVKAKTPLWANPALVYVDAKGGTWRKVSVERLIEKPKTWFFPAEHRTRTYRLEPGPKWAFPEIKARFLAEMESDEVADRMPDGVSREEVLAGVSRAETLLELFWTADKFILWGDDPDVAPEHRDRR